MRLLSIGERIKNLREKRNWTQLYLAEKIGMNNSVLSRIEAGKRPVEDHEIKLFADVFEVSTDFLLFGRTDPDHGQANVSPEEKEFLDWVKENLDGAFFYDFSKSPEEQKEEVMRGLRLIWELEKNRKPGQKQGE